MKSAAERISKRITAIVTAAAVALGLFWAPDNKVLAEEEKLIDVYYAITQLQDTALSSGINYLFLPKDNGDNDVSNYTGDKKIADVDAPNIDYAQPTLPDGCYIFTYAPGQNVTINTTPHGKTSSEKANVTVYKQGGADKCHEGYLGYWDDKYHYWCSGHGIHGVMGHLYSYSEAKVSSEAFKIIPKEEISGKTTLTQEELKLYVTINGKDYDVEYITFTDPDVDPENNDWTISVKFTDFNAASSYTFDIEKPPLTVSFDMNGHGVAPATRYVFSGNTASKPDDPSVDGYYFEGWYTEADCVNPYDFSTPVTADIKLYAKWVPHLQITTIALPDGVTGTPYGEGLIATGGEGTISWAVISGPLPPGLEFDISTGAISGTPKTAGEYTFTVQAADGTGHVATRELKITVTEKAIATYMVSFDINGHGTAPQAQIISEGGHAVKPDDLIAEGYVFTGWYKDAACTETFSFSKDTITADTTVYAGWRAIPTPEPYSDPEPAPDPVPSEEPGPSASSSGSQTKAEEEPSPDYDGHEHIYEWTTISTASEDEDGIMAYTCTICGATLYSVPVTAYYVFNRNTAEKVKNAGQGAEVDISTSRWISFHRMVLEALSKRPDVTLNLSYLSGGHKGDRRSLTIPAGADDIALLNGGDYAGFSYISEHISDALPDSQRADASFNQAGTAASPARTAAGASTAGAVITILPGMGSDDAAALLEQAGVVDSARRFDQYLCDYCYDRRIHSGTATIPEGASWEDIARILTGATAGQTATAPSAQTTADTESTANQTKTSTSETTTSDGSVSETSTPSDPQKPSVDGTVEIGIPGGVSSYQVAKLLEQAGLVDSARTFDNYLCDNGYDTRIRTGIKAIPADADEEKIAQIITR